ncbi:hypothetical protein DEDE109153_01060 [Deinococcus deserti]
MTSGAYMLACTLFTLENVAPYLSGSLGCLSFAGPSLKFTNGATCTRAA